MKTETEAEPSTGTGTGLVLVQVYFDGGCEPNPGNGYGSYETVSDNAKYVNFVSRQKFGHMTCNMAEWNALLCALEWLTEQAPLDTLEIEIWTDSMLVCQQLQEHWRCKLWYLRELRDQCLNLLRIAGKWSIHWYRRDNNVLRFGH